MYCLLHVPPMHGHGGGGAPQQGQRGGGGNRRTPPAWSPERESSYSLQNYCQDLLAWSILATDMDPAQQTSAIILQLGGAARELARNMTYHDITQGGMIGGNQRDPVTFLLTIWRSSSHPWEGRRDCKPSVKARNPKI